MCAVDTLNELWKHLLGVTHPTLYSVFTKLFRSVGNSVTLTPTVSREHFQVLNLLLVFLVFTTHTVSVTNVFRTPIRVLGTLHCIRYLVFDLLISFREFATHSRSLLNT